ncbi:DUF443 family protein [Listeria kieliensis]|uniref:DUF443 family protein n=1 Tax=Listeria kieliensis TaxID=1621700 RepID=A0A3D8TT05_9LIST|nr:DUF443 family protein [Listeria kieliensis]RDX02101.1 hypothetical protein UR08_00760 [Listeria kieliensis]
MNQEIRATKKAQFKTIQYNNKRYIIDVASNKGWLASVFTWSKKKNAYLLVENDKNRAILEKRSVDSDLAIGLALIIVSIGGFSSRKYLNVFNTNLSDLFSVVLLISSAIVVFLSYFFAIRKNQQGLKQLIGKESINIQIRSSSLDMVNYYIKNILIFLVLLCLVIFSCTMFILYHYLIFYFMAILFLLVCLYAGIATMRLPKIYDIVIKAD